MPRHIKLVSVGTSAVVYPAAELPRIAMDGDATTVEINIKDTPFSHHYGHLARGRASELLRKMTGAPR